MTLTPYATLEQLREYVRVTNPLDTVDDDIAVLALVAARTAIDRACRRTFDDAGPTEARVFHATVDRETLRTVIVIDDTPSDADDIDLAYDPLQEGVYTTAITGAFRCFPLDAPVTERPFVKIVFARTTAVPVGEVEVTTSYGWDPTPATIVQANLLQASRYLKRRDAPFGVAGSPDVGSELRLLSKLDPDVEMMVGDYRRWDR